MGSSELRPRDRRQATLEGNDRALGDAGEPAATVRAFFHFGSSFFFSVWRKVQGGTLPGLCMDWDRGGARHDIVRMKVNTVNSGPPAMCRPVTWRLPLSLSPVKNHEDLVSLRCPHAAQDP